MSSPLSHHTPVAIAVANPTLSEAIASILPALEHFLTFAEPETTGLLRESWTEQLATPLPQAGEGSEAVLTALRDIVIPHGLRVGATGFTGWMSMMPAPIPVVASLAGTVAGPQRWWVQSFNTLEQVALEWLGELLGIPASYQGLFSSGGAMANLIALGVARQQAAERLGIDAAQAGITGLPLPRFYATSETHHIIQRAVAILGFGRDALVQIPTDDLLRMDVAALRERIAADRRQGATPIAVIGSAGTTNTGSLDPLPAIGQFCREEGIWFHIDGAYGLLGIVDPAIAPLYGDLGDADSLVIDPHKWLNAPIGCGCTFVRDRALMYRTFALGDAAYLHEGATLGQASAPLSQFADYGYQFHELGIELSAPSRGVQVWAILKEQGSVGIRERVQNNREQARLLAALVERSPVLELALPVTLSIGCFRYVPPELRGHEDAAIRMRLNRFNQQLLEQLQGRGNVVPSGTTVHGNFVLRPCFINPRGSAADVERLVTEVEQVGASLWSNFSTGEVLK